MNDAMLSAILQKGLGGKRLLICDIGARGGVHPRWNPFFSVIEVLGFEPDQAECQELNKSARTLPYKARFLPHALGRSFEQNVKFYICQQPGCSSMYEPNSDFLRDFAYAPAMEVKATTTLNTVTLSEVSSRERLQPDVIKIDVQGAELDILIGGADLLAKTKFIELEVEFNEQYRDQPLFHDIDKFMRAQGWVLLGLRRDYWRRKNGLSKSIDGCGGHLMHGDALYYNPRCLETAVNDGEELLKVLMILSAYRQNDFLLSLLRSSSQALKAVSDKERAVLEGHLLHSPTLFFRLLRWIVQGIDHRTKRRLVDALQLGNVTDWHDPDFF